MKRVIPKLNAYTAMQWDGENTEDVKTFLGLEATIAHLPKGMNVGGHIYKQEALLVYHAGQVVPIQAFDWIVKMRGYLLGVSDADFPGLFRDMTPSFDNVPDL